MNTISKESKIIIYWKIWRGANKTSEDFNNVNTNLKVFLVGTENTYSLDPTIDLEIDPGYKVLKVEVNPDTLALDTGVYDIRAIWSKNGGRDFLKSSKSGVLSIDDKAEVVETETIRLVSYVESFGSDGLTAYEIAVIRGLNAGISSEVEWVGSEVDRQKAEEKRDKAETARDDAEKARDGAEALRVETFDANEETRRTTFETNEGNRGATFTSNETSREEAYLLSEQDRDVRFAAAEENRNKGEAIRQAAFEGGENERESTFTRNEESRQRRFEDEVEQRSEAFNAYESSRQHAFEENERNRGLVFSAAEEERERQETIRQENENTRLTQESVRQQAEQIRIDTFDENERERIATFETNEAARQTNETTRIANEEERIANEAIRQESYLDKVPTSAIVQEIGDSESLIMSQKAVSREIVEMDSALYHYDHSVVNATIRGRNLLINKTGIVVESTAYADKVTNDIPVSPYTKYYISGSSWFGYNIYAFYDKDGSYIDGLASSAGSVVTSIIGREVVAPSNAAFLVIAESGGSSGNEGQEIGIEEGIKKSKVGILEARVDDIENEIYELADIAIPCEIEHKQSILKKGDVSPSSAYADNVSNIAPIAQGATYLISGSSWFGHNIYSVYDSDGEYIDGMASASGSDVTSIIGHEYTPPINASYMRIAESGGSTGKEGTKIGLIQKNVKVLKTPDSTSLLKGKKWAAMGDSLTEANKRTTKHYHTYIAEETGVEVVNLGMSGTGYAKRQSENVAFYQRVSTIPLDSDLVTIFGSFNDITADIELGSITDSGTETMCGCINTTIDNIQSILPTVRLGIITPSPWAGYKPTAGENTSAEKYVEAIIKICRYRSIPCLDLYRCSNLRPWDEDFRILAYSKDNGGGVHPDETGHELMHGRIREFILSLL